VALADLSELWLSKKPARNGVGLVLQRQIFLVYKSFFSSSLKELVTEHWGFAMHKQFDFSFERNFNLARSQGGEMVIEAS